jgi:transposase-like protein
MATAHEERARPPLTLAGPTLDEIAREGARRMLTEALEAEVADYIDRHQVRDANGRARVVRNGKARPRKVTLGSGTIEVSAPRVDDRRQDEMGERHRFRSAILPPYMRRSPKVSEILPILYLRGLSTGDFKPALTTLLGEEASGLSATAITRMTEAWQGDYDAFRGRDLSDRDYVYVWADGIHFRIRLEEDRLCALVMIGVRPDGTKELIAIEDGYRESAESWASVLRDLASRGMRAPGSLLVTAHSASGRRYPTCGPRPASKGAGCTGSQTSSTSSRSAFMGGQRPLCTRSCGPRLGRPPRTPWPCSSASTGRSTPRRSRPCAGTRPSCSHSSTSPPSTGCTCARAT